MMRRLNAWCRSLTPTLDGRLGEYGMEDLVSHFSPDALVEHLNGRPDLSAEERSALRRQYEAYCNEKLGIAGSTTDVEGASTAQE